MTPADRRRAETSVGDAYGRLMLIVLVAVIVLGTALAVGPPGAFVVLAVVFMIALKKAWVRAQRQTAEE